MLIFIQNHYAEILSTIAIILSLAQIIVSGINNRTNLELTVEDVQQYKIADKISIIILFTLVNNSKSPINITRIILVGKNNQSVPCNLRKSYIGEHYYPKYPETDLPRTERVFSADLPISLSGNGAKSIHLLFETPPDFTDYSNGDIIYFSVKTDKKNLNLTGKCLIHDNGTMKYL